jgi:hypothetical protein
VEACFVSIQQAGMAGTTCREQTAMAIIETCGLLNVLPTLLLLQAILTSFGVTTLYIAFMVACWSC